MAANRERRGADRQICAHRAVAPSRWRYGCDVPYRGPVPQLPTDANRPRRIGSAAELEAMRTPRERAQQPLVEAADRIQVLVREREYGGFGVLALEDDPPAVVLFWKGRLPRPVQHLVDELLDRSCRGS